VGSAVIGAVLIGAVPLRTGVGMAAVTVIGRAGPAVVIGVVRVGTEGAGSAAVIGLLRVGTEVTATAARTGAVRAVVIGRANSTAMSGVASWAATEIGRARGTPSPDRGGRTPPTGAADSPTATGAAGTAAIVSAATRGTTAPGGPTTTARRGGIGTIVAPAEVIRPATGAARRLLDRRVPAEWPTQAGRTLVLSRTVVRGRTAAVGPTAVVGQKAVVGPTVVRGRTAVVGPTAAVGQKAVRGQKAVVGPTAVRGRKAAVGQKAVRGRTAVGQKAVVGGIGVVSARGLGASPGAAAGRTPTGTWSGSPGCRHRPCRKAWRT